jgi:hypothetical protein
LKQFRLGECSIKLLRSAACVGWVHQWELEFTSEFLTSHPSLHIQCQNNESFPSWFVL